MLRKRGENKKGVAETEVQWEMGEGRTKEETGEERQKKIKENRNRIEKNEDERRKKSREGVEMTESMGKKERSK